MNNYRNIIWSGSLAIINRLILLFLMWPAVGLFILVAVCSDLTFSGAGRLLVDMQYEAQQLGKAELEGHLVVKRCASETEEGIGMPKSLTCEYWKTQEVPVDDLAKKQERC